MQQFSFYGRVCAMKGLLQALPKDVLCAKLQKPLGKQKSEQQQHQDAGL